MARTAPQLADERITGEIPPPVTLRLRPVIDLTSDQLLELSSLNEGLRLELTAKGELIVMSPNGGNSSERNSEINLQLRLWAKRDGTGIAYEATGGFELPNGAKRSPDAAWVLRSRLAFLSDAQREKFLPVCPDFVIELRSPSDRLRTLQSKMREYLTNGTRLGWLIDPFNRRVHVYRPDAPEMQLDDPATISGDPVLPGFVLDLREIW